MKYYQKIPWDMFTFHMHGTVNQGEIRNKLLKILNSLVKVIYLKLHKYFCSHQTYPCPAFTHQS